MGIGFGSGNLLDLVLFEDRTNAEPKSNRSTSSIIVLCFMGHGRFATI